MINLSLIPQFKTDAYPFNDDQKAWLTELETGKRVQGRGWLQIDGRFCCLGVACSVMGAEASQGWSTSMVYEVGEHKADKDLPLPLVYRLRMRGRSGNFAQPVRINGSEYNALTAMNDDYANPKDHYLAPALADTKFSFQDIAAYIRHDPWNVFYGPSEVNPDGVPLS